MVPFEFVGALNVADTSYPGANYGRGIGIARCASSTSNMPWYILHGASWVTGMTSK